ncbi:hypothetical protein DAPPUDRAFT_260131 [Daphnia pulex]|uniref:Uncharacterized protein n=1 Tax=Daphnia pulex TaxID=6669 RepID=E9HIK3_DAPPU|nr:hypothetical protein DAPPUDRAFT_260131 [Daphnia pulex]|eukprot:EFX68446.1 hypothetical protein DAPPUDRAFT_260131 [Daphnia pulex]
MPEDELSTLNFGYPKHTWYETSDGLEYVVKKLTIDTKTGVRIPHWAGLFSKILTSNNLEWKLEKSLIEKLLLGLDTSQQISAYCGNILNGDQSSSVSMLVIPKQMEVDSDVSTATPCSKRRSRRTTEVFCDDDGRFNFKNWHKYFESGLVQRIWIRFRTSFKTV